MAATAAPTGTLLLGHALILAYPSECSQNVPCGTACVLEVEETPRLGRTTRTHVFKTEQARCAVLLDGVLLARGLRRIHPLTYAFNKCIYYITRHFFCLRLTYVCPHRPAVPYLAAAACRLTLI
jgi:hypothetical protein